MKKLFTITTLLIITNSYIQSADWISDHLPAALKVDQQYRDQVKFIQEKTGTSTPIIFVKDNGKKNAASVVNIGAGPCRFAFMFINQADFQSNKFNRNIQAFAHETVHVDQNHCGASNVMLFGGIGMIGSSPLLKIAQYATSIPLRAGRTLALGTSLVAARLLYPKDPFEDQKLDEYEAEEKSFEKLRQLGLCDTLDNLSAKYARYASWDLQRPEIYPPHQQMHEWAEKMSLECRQNEKNNH